jgi:hypothetical protein
MQQPQGHHFTGPEVRFRMFGDGVQLFIGLGRGLETLSASNRYTTTS